MNSKKAVLISPQFPRTYYKFAEALRLQGWTVLGIGDTPYTAIPYELTQNLNEYYYCPNMNDYAELYKAVAFLAFKYGKIDLIESNNEHWLEKDARLREDFNCTEGFRLNEIQALKAKSTMKQFYQHANVPFARYYLVENLEGCLAFIHQVGYPVFVKPNIGVGSIASKKIDSLAKLELFLATKDSAQYIMEEFIDGTTISYDGVCNDQSDVVLEVSHVYPTPNHEIVTSLTEDYYYTEPNIPNDLAVIGKRVVKAFGLKKRFFHLEFFRLNNDHAYLGKKGSIVALEANLRTPGGYTPEMINASQSINCYAVWADVVTFNENKQPINLPKFYCAEVARRDGKSYVYSHQDIMQNYGHLMVFEGRYPPVINVGMGDQFYIIKASSIEACESFKQDVLKHKVQTITWTMTGS
jgi:hypothetical protein